MGNPLVLDEEDVESIPIKKEIVEETKEELKKDIPSSYIPIELTSNGRIEGVPKVLHFRSPSASDCLDMSVSDENEKPKVIGKVLTRLCFEKFDILKLPIQDVLHILYVLHGSFISSTITKNVYIDLMLPDGEDDGCLDNKSNITEVDIPISSIKYIFLGKDKNDNNLENHIKIPFTISDKFGNKAKFRLPILEDSIIAEKYCKNFYKDDFIKFAGIKRDLANINNIKDEEKRNVEYTNYVSDNEDEYNEYFNFMEEFSLKVAKVVQSLQLVEYNGKKLEELEDKWTVYEEIPINMWNTYNKVFEDYPFGIQDDVKVYIPELKKKVDRRVSFQLSDFLQSNNTESTDGYSVSFD